MRPGHPFKYRMGGRPHIGMLSTPDVIKFRIPIPYAFVFPDKNKTVNRKTGQFTEQNHSKPRNNLISAGDFEINSNCQLQVMNFNRCIKNTNVSEYCQYYMNYLKANCKKT